MLSPKPTDPSQKPEGYVIVTYQVGDGGDPNVYKDFTDKLEGSVTVRGNMFAINGKTFIGWKDAKTNGLVEIGTTLIADTTLIAQWKDTGSVVLTINDPKVKNVELDGENEKVLVMRGSWADTNDVAEDKTYTINVLVTAKPPRMTSCAGMWMLTATPTSSALPATSPPMTLWISMPRLARSR